ncbi:hypothetical protein D9757_007448 [Collybiopsis confluens]|uniref:Peptidase C14 caspase domain-containing protein n=1 Tax=Collybiopsis confluens TaxID=2823264 RepID=A0A8H5HJG3_9AGAR|nr:hypothetical protein D9757_007448 [Collybiopsis confluens]
MTAATMHALLVGINEYKDLDTPLKHSVADALRLQESLKRLGADERNLRLLADSNATKDGITNALQSLSSQVKRTDAVVFFFSGYAGVSEDADGNKIGLISPYDVKTNGGLSAASLLRAFDVLSKRCGGNVTIFLDTVGERFKWDNPTSCVVVYPNVAAEDERGGMFTSAIIEVLKESDCSNFTSIPMTVDLFAKRVEYKIQLGSDEAVVRRTGTNVDRPLFRSEGDQGHYALIPGRVSKGGIIILGAGAAHSVQVGDRYKIYERNIPIEGADEFGELCDRELRVDTVRGLSSDLSLTGQSTLDLPTFFYAIERFSAKVKIAIGDSTVLEGVHSGWDRASQSKRDANISLEEADDRLHFIWNGLDGDEKYPDRRDRDESVAVEHPKGPDDVPRDLRRLVRRAARFNRNVSAPPPSKSELEKLRFEIKKVDTGAKEPEGKDLLCNDRVELTCSSDGQVEGPYCLTIYNDNPFPVWPYVFMCDPEDFTMVPWYMPDQGLLEAPLEAKDKPNNSLTIGLENADVILFEHRENRERDFLYLKIFVTQREADFSCLQQWYWSLRENTLRQDHKPVGKRGQGNASVRLPSELQHKKRTTLSVWFSKRITFEVKYKEEDNESEAGREVLLDPEEEAEEAYHQRISKQGKSKNRKTSGKIMKEREEARAQRAAPPSTRSRASSQ